VRVKYTDADCWPVMSCARVVNEGLAIKRWLFLEVALLISWTGHFKRLDP
jgi:hypothetical protein